jgi:DNA-binding CsgD family transcriptional regulator
MAAATLPATSMTLSLSAQDVTLFRRVSEALLQPLPRDWLIAEPDLASDLQRLLSMDFIGTTNWNPARRAYENAMCAGRGPDMARAYVEEFQCCDPISPILRKRRGPTPIYAAISREQLRRTRYFNDFLRVYRTTDGIDLHLCDGDINVGDFRFWRAEGRTPIGAREVALLRLLEPALLRALRGLRDSAPAFEASAELALTDREIQIAALVVRGLTDRSIAETLGISYWTVRTHLEHMFRKLEVKNRAALVARLARARS